MRALAHPARLAIMEHLNSTGRRRTATECAEIVGLSPSATSYHLRELAKVGLIEEAPSRGDGRERVWQSPVHSVQHRRSTAATTRRPRAAEEALMEVYLTRDFARLRAYLARVAGRAAGVARRRSALMGSRPAGHRRGAEGVHRAAVHELIEPLKRRNAGSPIRRRARVPVPCHFAAFPTTDRGCAWQM